jgi:dipeptidase D
VTGLRGGHSGTDIGRGRGNAIRILAQCLDGLLVRHGAALGAVQGGNKRNAIPREASATLHVAPERAAALEEDVARLGASFRAALRELDPGVAVSIAEGEGGPAMSAEDARAVVGFLLAAPNGVEAMSRDVPGLVETSTNLGVVVTRHAAVEVTFLTRSAVDASKRALAGAVAAAAALAGFEARHLGRYPGWKPEPASALVGLLQRAHARALGGGMELRAMHAGLECALVGEKSPGMEMVSIGPTILDAHTPDERVSIPSVERFWRLLVAVLESA